MPYFRGNGPQGCLAGTDGMGKAEGDGKIAIG